jgi:phosphatidate cytidylyltransferase
MIMERILSTVALWAVLIATPALFGTGGCFALLVAFSALTQYELYRLLQLAGYKPAVALGIACGLIMQAQCVIGCGIGLSEGLLSAIVVVALYLFSKRSLLIIRESLLPTLLGIVYVPFMFTFPVAFVCEMRCAHGVPHFTSLCTILLFVAIAKFSDIGGMIFGGAFGRHRLAPDFSPNKTWEGFAGGIVTSIAGGLAIFLPLRRFMIHSLTPGHVTLMAGILSVLAALGDLIESTVKRIAGVKDSGRVIPGIGGAFDLTDSLILALPIGILYVKHAVTWA